MTVPFRPRRTCAPNAAARTQPLAQPPSLEDEGHDGVTQRHQQIPVEATR